MPEPMALLATADPVAGFFAAHRTGREIALDTSGTSGTPRTVIRSTDSWVDSFATVAELSGIDTESRVWIPGPNSATMNLFARVHTHWAQAALVETPEAATHAHLSVSTLLGTAPERLRGCHVITAGDRLSAAAHAAWAAAGVRVSHYYGAAELSFVAWGPHAAELTRFPGVEVVARDGELWVCSPFLARGYQQSQHRLRRDSAGWVTVGDRGTVIGDRLTIYGRGGGITTAGATVSVAEIEHALGAELNGSLVVVGVPHGVVGEVVTAVLTDPADEELARRTSRSVLTPAQRPRRWVIRNPLPLTAQGKVDRAELVKQIEGGSR